MDQCFVQVKHKRRHGSFLGRQQVMRPLYNLNSSLQHRLHLVPTSKSSINQLTYQKLCWGFYGQCRLCSSLPLTEVKLPFLSRLSLIANIGLQISHFRSRPSELALLAGRCYFVSPRS
jgi:hypothetical protein